MAPLLGTKMESQTARCRRGGDPNTGHGCSVVDVRAHQHEGGRSATATARLSAAARQVQERACKGHVGPLTGHAPGPRQVSQGSSVFVAPSPQNVNRPSARFAGSGSRTSLACTRRVPTRSDPADSPRTARHRTVVAESIISLDPVPRREVLGYEGSRTGTMTSVRYSSGDSSPGSFRYASIGGPTTSNPWSAIHAIRRSYAGATSS